MSELVLSTEKLTKSEMKRFSDSMINDVLDGNVDPIQSVIQARYIYDAVGGFLKDKQVNETVVREIEKYGRDCILHGVQLQLRNTGVKYSFDGCNDPVYNELKRQLDELSAKIKAREEFLKHVPEDGLEVADPDTGEMSHVWRPAKSCNESFAITFPK